MQRKDATDTTEAVILKISQKLDLAGCQQISHMYVVCF